MIKVHGLGNLEASFNRLIKRAEKKIVDLRKQVAVELMDAILANTPVWSGKTVRSIAVGPNTTGGNRNEPHPQRRDYAEDGWWLPDPVYGPTSRQRLGAENMRKSSEAIARASVDSADYGMDSKVFISSDAYLWRRVNKAEAPEAGTARNKAVVSDLAIAQVKAKFGKQLK